MHNDSRSLRQGLPQPLNQEVNNVTVVHDVQRGRPQEHIRHLLAQQLTPLHHLISRHGLLVQHIHHDPNVLCNEPARIGSPIPVGQEQGRLSRQ
jgi:hypothetical protein